MKKFLYLFLLTFVSLFSICQTASAQQINAIQSRCPSPSLFNSSIRALGSGDIAYTPCNGFSSIFYGNVDFSNATVTGAVTGTGTANYVPRFTSASVIGNTPLSWNGTTYNFNNTALNSTAPLTFNPTTGRMTLLDSAFAPSYLGNTILSIGQTAPINSTTLRGQNIYVDSNSSALGQLSGISPRVNFSGSGNVPVSTATESFNTNVGASATNQYMQGVEAVVQPTSASGSVGNAIGFEAFVNPSSGSASVTDIAHFRSVTTAQTSVTRLTGLFPRLQTFGAGAVGTAYGLKLAEWSGSNFTTSYGIYADATIDRGATRYFIYSLSTSPSYFTGKLAFDNTIQVGNGDTTINKPSGIVNMDTAAASLIVTNSFVTSTSLILVTSQVQDATCQSFSVTSKGAGVFAIAANVACTSPTAIGFLVINQ